MALGPDKRLERQAGILRATRLALAREGSERLTMRGLAKESGVTVNTLYNSFASKDDLVGAAVEDLVRVLVAGVERDPACRGLARVRAVSHLTTDTMESDPEYMRAAIVLSGTPRLAPTSTDKLREMYVTGLQEMVNDGIIAPWTPCAAFADAIASLFKGINHDWARGRLTVAEVRRQKNLGLAALLLGVAQGDLARRLRDETLALSLETDTGSSLAECVATGESGAIEA